jgi:hypothetical protein
MQISSGSLRSNLLMNCLLCFDVYYRLVTGNTSQTSLCVQCLSSFCSDSRTMFWFKLSLTLKPTELFPRIFFSVSNEVRKGEFLLWPTGWITRYNSLTRKTCCLSNGVTFVYFYETWNFHHVRNAVDLIIRNIVPKIMPCVVDVSILAVRNRWKWTKCRHSQNAF